MRRKKGFTLIELMVAVAVIGVLGMIAIPSYREYVYRGNRTVAKAALMQVASRQESFMSDRKGYSNTLVGLGYAAETLGVGSDGTLGSSKPIYQLAFDGVPSLVYFKLKATPVGGQVKDSCGVLTIDSAGVKTPSPAANSKCWGR